MTDRELDLIGVLWERGPSTVPEVRKWLAKELAYTTVLTILRTLDEKGYVAHWEEGGAHRCRPLVERDQAGDRALDGITRKLFRCSPELLLTHLVTDQRLSAAELRRMRELLDERLQEEEK